MKNPRPASFCLVISIFISAFICAPALAGWGENVRLTYRGNEILPQVVARNDTIHVAWSQIYGHVSYIRSTDGGATWDSLVNLTQAGHTGQYPKMHLAENGLLITWMDNNGAITEIAVATSANGESWNAPIYYATDNPNRFGNPTSAVKGDSIFLAYVSSRDDSTGPLPIRSTYSYNYGHNWSDERTVGHLLTTPPLMSLLYCNGTLIITLTDAPDSNHINFFNINGYRSLDGGMTWTGPFIISPPNQHGADEACGACNIVSGQIAVGYKDYRYSPYLTHGDIFISISNDSSLTWPFETQATTMPTAMTPSINIIEDTLIAVWSDVRYFLQDGWNEIVFNRSNNSGITWQGEERITNSEDQSYEPTLSFDEGNIHIVWRERLANIGMEIYYKKFTPDSLVNIENQEFSPLPDITISAYPNPFNSNLTVSMESNTDGVIFIYDIQGKIIRQFDYKKGSQRINWDGKTDYNQPLTSGVYFIGRKGDLKGKTLKVVYLK